MIAETEDWAAFWDEKAELPADFAATGRSRLDVVAFLYTVREAARILQLTPHDRLLDIGCGTGIFALALSPQVKHIHVTDISPRMVERAARTLSDLANVTSSHSSIVKLDQPDASFDKVLAYSVLQYLTSEDEALEALREVRRVLRPGGRALLAANPDPARSHLLDAVGEGGGLQKIGLADRTLWIAPERLVALAETAGFGAASAPIHPRIWQHFYMYDLVVDHAG